MKTTFKLIVRLRTNLFYAVQISIVVHDIAVTLEIDVPTLNLYENLSIPENRKQTKKINITWKVPGKVLKHHETSLQVFLRVEKYR